MTATLSKASMKMISLPLQRVGCHASNSSLNLTSGLTVSVHCYMDLAEQKKRASDSQTATLPHKLGSHPPHFFKAGDPRSCRNRSSHRKRNDRHCVGQGRYWPVQLHRVSDIWAASRTQPSGLSPARWTLLPFSLLHFVLPPSTLQKVSCVMNEFYGVPHGTAVLLIFLG